MVWFGFACFTDLDLWGERKRIVLLEEKVKKSKTAVLVHAAGGDLKAQRGWLSAPLSWGGGWRTRCTHPSWIYYWCWRCWTTAQGCLSRYSCVFCPVYGVILLDPHWTWMWPPEQQSLLTVRLIFILFHLFISFSAKKTQNFTFTYPFIDSWAKCYQSVITVFF